MEKKVMLLSIIDNKKFGMAVPKEVVEVAVSFAIKYGATGMMIVHAGTNELIAGFDEYEAAKERGDTEVEVLVWDIPKPLLFGAQVLKNAKGLNYQEGSPLAKQAMEYFSLKKGGDGAELRKMVDPDDLGLADFVAKLFGTNRTTLYSWLKVAEEKPELLKFVDNGTVTMGAAERVVNQRSGKVGSTEESGNKKKAESTLENKRRFVKHDEITSPSQLTPSELNLATDVLPEFLTRFSKLNVIPKDVLVERTYQHISKKGAKKGAEEPAAKVDHLSIGLELSNFEVLITIHEIDGVEASAVAIKLPVNPPDIGRADDEFAVAA